MVVSYEFCGDSLCSVALDGTRTRDEALMVREFDALAAMLQTQLGAPSIQVRRAGSGCSGHLPLCLTSRQAEYSARWSWRNGPQVSLSVDALEDDALVAQVAMAWLTRERVTWDAGPPPPAPASARDARRRRLRRAMIRRPAALLAALLAAAPARAQQDPRLQWQTLQTPHFNIHFYQDMEPVARRVADISEGVAARLAGPLGWSPQGRTEIVLSDVSDDANGSATAIPFNTVRLFLTAPDDLSALSQHEDWLTTLVTHEYTHILHTDNISGLPAIVNAVIGKQWAPNQIQARFVLEGLATYEESLRTRGGRLRSSIWDMHLRADALEDNLVTLDQLASGPNRWPHGNIWYLYGSYLMQYVADRFGHDVLARLSSEYGSMAAPWQLNRAIARATGRTWEQLYDDFLDATRARYAQQRRVIASQGVMQGAALTAQGETVRSPRFLADGTLVYETGDGQSQTALRAIPADFFRTWDHRTAARPAPYELDWLASPSGFAQVSPTALLVSDIAAHRDVHFFHDLYRWTLSRDDRGRAPPSTAPSGSPTAGARSSPTSPPTATGWSSPPTTAARAPSWRCPSPTACPT